MNLDDKGKIEIRTLLGESTKTEAFIDEAERAIGTYFSTKGAESRWLNAGPRVDKYKKIANYSSKLSKIINEIPENQWGLISQQWFLRSGEQAPLDQIGLIDLLQNLAIATEDATGDLIPVKRGPKHKLENWIFINGLMKPYRVNFFQGEFTRTFTNDGVSYSDGGTFQEIVTAVYNNSSEIMDNLDPDQAIRDYLNNS